MKEKYRDFDRLDPRLFKAFHAVAVNASFTQAARHAAMTQSGVSQQISKLEEQLGVSLFKRLPKQVVLTEAGRRLVRFVEFYFEELGTLMADVQSLDTELAGRVAYAMPESCLLSRHLDELLLQCQKHPRIELDVRIAPNEAVLTMIENGTVDFGFVTAEPVHAALEGRVFCQEELILIAGSAEQLRRVNERSLPSLPFVTFPGMDVLFEGWREHHFPRAANHARRASRGGAHHVARRGRPIRRKERGPLRFTSPLRRVRARTGHTPRVHRECEAAPQRRVPGHPRERTKNAPCRGRDSMVLRHDRRG